MNNNEKLKFRSSALFSELQLLYSRVDDVKGGTDSMRDAGQLYLPKGPAEPLKNYTQRLNRSIASPIYWRTIEKGVGKAFTKGLIVDKLPDMLEILKDNADGAGTSLESFSKIVLKDAIHYGVTYLLVDYPVLTPNATLADERNAGAAPYFVNINPTYVLDLRTAFIKNGVQPVYFRFLESVTEFDDDYNENTINQVKEFIRIETEDGRSFVRYKIYRVDENDEQYLYDENDLPNMENIPLVPVYGNKTSQYIGTPTLLELANQSISYWALHSGYQNILSSSGTPLLTVKGLASGTDEDGNPIEFVLSPNTAYFLEENGSIDYVEPSGNAADILDKAITKLETQMYASGLELVAASTATNLRSTQAETATGRIIDAAESNSILKSIVTDFTWALYHAFIIAGDMIGVDASETTVDIDTSFSVTGDLAFADLMNLYMEGVITASELMDELKTKGSFQSETLINKTVFNETNTGNVDTVVVDDSRDTNSVIE